MTSHPILDWERMYRENQWDYLDGVSEFSRYAVIAGYIRKLARDAHVLDLGCGQALLRNCLHPDSVSAYTGVDISPTAIGSTGASTDNAKFIIGPVETVRLSEECYDVIVCNEILYCLSRPLETLRRYTSRLTAGGLLIVSMYSHNRHSRDGMNRVAAIWGELDSFGLTTVDGTTVINLAHRLEWTVKAFRK